MQKIVFFNGIRFSFRENIEYQVYVQKGQQDIRGVFVFLYDDRIEIDSKILEGLVSFKLIGKFYLYLYGLKVKWYF